MSGTSLSDLPQPQLANITPLPPSGMQQQQSYSQQTHYPPENTLPGHLDPNIAARLASDVAKASAHGGMSLPSRDIPADPHTITADPMSVPSHIPAPAQNNYKYISPSGTFTSSIDTSFAWVDTLLVNLHMPIIAALIFFLFQMPAINRIFRGIKSLYSEDGNMTLGGQAFKSVIYGGVMFLIIHILSGINGTF